MGAGPSTRETADSCRATLFAVRTFLSPTALNTDLTGFSTTSLKTFFTGLKTTFLTVFSTFFRALRTKPELSSGAQAITIKQMIMSRTQVDFLIL